MQKTEKMVQERVVWEKLDNLQVFCGANQFFFAFKKLRKDNVVDGTFRRLLVPKANEIINFEGDIGRKEYAEQIKEGLFEYDQMPPEFYLRKIHQYSTTCAAPRIDLEDARALIAQKKVLRDAQFVKKALKAYLKTCKPGDANRDTKRQVDSLDLKETLFVLQLFDFWKKYRDNPKYKKICDDYIAFSSRQKHVDWKLSGTQLGAEKLEFLDLLYRTKTFDNGKGSASLISGYELNVDNYLKIMLILQKQRAGIPVIIMGETGCGKTFLLKYIAEVIFQNKAVFFSFTLYYGVQEEHFVEFVDDIIRIAERRPELDVWVFFDEFNTSELQSSICELMNDRTFSITNLKAYKCKPDSHAGD